VVKTVEDTVPNQTNVDIVRAQQTLNLLRFQPVGKVPHGSFEGTFIPVDVRKVKGTTEFVIDLVIVHNGVREKVSVPVSHQTTSVWSGYREHLANYIGSDLFGHDVQRVVDAHNKRLLEAIFHGLPPFVEIQHVELEEGTVGTVKWVVLLAVFNETIVDIQAKAGDALGQIAEFTNDISSACVHL